MDDTRHAAPATTDTIDPDDELPFDDPEDLGWEGDGNDEDSVEPLADLGVPDELEHLGGYSESTALEDPPPE